MSAQTIAIQRTLREIDAALAHARAVSANPTEKLYAYLRAMRAQRETRDWQTGPVTRRHD